MYFISRIFLVAAQITATLAPQLLLLKHVDASGVSVQWRTGVSSPYNSLTVK